LPENTAATDIGVCKQDEPPALTYHPLLCFCCLLCAQFGKKKRGKKKRRI
jgi:hypothetical protein